MSDSDWVLTSLSTLLPYATGYRPVNSIFPWFPRKLSFMIWFTFPKNWHDSIQFYLSLSFSLSQSAFLQKSYRPRDGQTMRLKYLLIEMWWLYSKRYATETVDIVFIQNAQQPLSNLSLNQHNFWTNWARKLLLVP